MANESIRAAFERMWQHTVAKIGDKADKSDVEILQDLVGDEAVATQISEATANYLPLSGGVINGNVETDDAYMYNLGSNASPFGMVYASTFKGNLEGGATSAATAGKLSTDNGSATQPVYFSDGKPVACTYTLEKSVPSDAKFTDTTYTLSSFGITATASELNKLDGCTATVTELNYVDGVTSNIQTQLNGKAASTSPKISTSIELHGATPYIDFHFNNDQGDYTSRIIEATSGQLTIQAGLAVSTDVSTSGSFLARYSLYTGGRNALGEAKAGIVVGDNGHIYMTAAEPSIRFYSGTSASETGRIWCDGNMNFTNTITTNGSLQMGTSDKSGTNTIALGTYWNDKAYHYLVQRYDNGLTSAFGWAGTSSYASVTVIRGQSCKLGSASGTTITSDERLKKDFTSLEEWDKFFDAIEPCAFRLKNGNGGRFHMGFKAQQIEQALLDSGKTTQDFAGFVKSAYAFDEDDDPHNIAAYKEAGIKDGEDEYGLIYTEFTALNTYQIQKLKAENKELKERIEKLEQALNL